MDGAGQRLYMEFVFLRASALEYTQSSTKTDRVVASFDGYEAYLLIVNKATHHVWVFLTKSKDRLVDTATDFLKIFGLADGGLIRCNQGGELARLRLFRMTIQKDHGYMIEPRGADDAAQNGGTELWNGTLAVGRFHF